MNTNQLIKIGFDETHDMCEACKDAVAVDRSKIPLGTKLLIEDIGARVAEDVGGGIKGQHIDIYYGTKLTLDEARKRTMGNRTVCKQL